MGGHELTNQNHTDSLLHSLQVGCGELVRELVLNGLMNPCKAETRL